MPIPEIDKLLGLEVYATQTPGVGGVIRKSIGDFVVEEVLVDNSNASMNDNITSKVLGSTSKKQKFLLCKLLKQNWDTFIAIKNIAKSLGIEQKRIQFAGIKDAKAITAQFITIENVLMEETAKINLKGIKIQPIGYVREQLSLFFLLGNNFNITIRQIEEETKAKIAITQIIQELNRIGGMPNFYGHQRFGTTRPITHLVGKALFQNKLKDAAMLYLANPSSHEHPKAKSAREELQSDENFRRASKNFPKQLRFERQMLLHLADYPNDFIGAFQRLPPKLFTLFFQAYQSYLFNRLLSSRIKIGLPLNKATTGDFVVGVERSRLPLTSRAKIVVSENLQQVNEQVKAGKLRVALPIIGLKQKLSQGIMGQIEKDVLIEEGVETDRICVNKLAKADGKGGLRTLIAPINNFNFQNHSGPEVLLSFMLFRGCYATIILREIMKPNDPITAGF